MAPLKDVESLSKPSFTLHIITNIMCQCLVVTCVKSAIYSVKLSHLIGSVG